MTKSTFLQLFLLQLITLGIIGQSHPTSQIEGRLELYDSNDDSSLYLGKGVADSIIQSLSLYNTFVGTTSGSRTTNGKYNTFVGSAAGKDNTTGQYNTYIGRSAGSNSTTPFRNTFTGYKSGIANTTGANNSFYGANTGISNSTGYNNSFFGPESGEELKTENSLLKGRLDKLENK